jgi:hypothetical protein
MASVALSELLALVVLPTHQLLEEELTQADLALSECGGGFGAGPATK